MRRPLADQLLDGLATEASVVVLAVQGEQLRECQSGALLDGAVQLEKGELHGLGK